MFYLVSKCERGFKLVGISDHQCDLLPKIEELQEENAASMPIVMDDKAMRAAFLVDGFGIVALDSGSLLVPLDEL